MRLQYCIWAILCLAIQTNAQTSKLPTILAGKVMTAVDNTGLADALVRLKVSNTFVATDDNGNFRVPLLHNTDTLVISLIGYSEFKMIVHSPDREFLSIILEPSAWQLKDVVINTGYQTIPKERATGSFVQVDHALLNRSVSTDILSRLDGVASGLIFNKNASGGQQVLQPNQSQIAIRGRSTIFANPNPLIIIDNFPYDGNLENINPNDVESITLLKDAAAASIWGARSGNGVIVITTKKGRAAQVPEVSVNTSVTVGNKPDLFYSPRLDAKDYVALQDTLFNNGYYTRYLPYTYYYKLPPVAMLLHGAQAGTITQEQADAQLNTFSQSDMRRDLSKYFFQKSVSQQYAFSIRGGSDYNRYYFSAGFDNNTPVQVANTYQRITLNANNTITTKDQRLAFTTGIAWSQNRTSFFNAYNTGYIYEPLATARGAAMPVTGYRTIAYTDTAGNGKLLDWHYRPLDELHNADNVSVLNDYRITARLSYRVLNGLEAALDYQYASGTENITDYYSLQTYTERDLVNSYTQLTGSAIKHVVPVGGITDLSENDYHSQNLRGQVSYNHTWHDKHALAAIAGMEVKDLHTQSRSYRLYGYDPALQTSTPVDFANMYPLYNYGSALVPGNISNRQTINRFIDYYTNVSYTYNNRYTVSFSARRDESNLFGVHTNQKGIPLGSLGLAWAIMKTLKLRVTDGFNGNLDNTASAYTTAVYSQAVNRFGANFESIQNPPDPTLRWEKDRMFNIGLDFAALKNRLTGSLEYYNRKSIDLLGYSPLANQTGVLEFYGNTADMKGRGMDITLHSNNLEGRFSWSSDFLLNYTSDKITAYKEPLTSIGDYLAPGFINPVAGRPVYSVYSLKWAGLGNQGNPQGKLGKDVSEDYGAILASTDFNDLAYNGPANPTVFGSLRNTFSWKQFSLSFNITYKFGYYFRRPSISYSDLFSGGAGSPDYLQRWQKRGDEAKTNVPSMIYPADGQRDDFYSFSEILVEKGDHIRLKDIQASYDIPVQKLRHLPFKSLRVYLYANNLGILWRANHSGIDPDNVPSGGPGFVYPDPKTFSAGVKIDL